MLTLRQVLISMVLVYWSNSRWMWNTSWDRRAVRFAQSVTDTNTGELPTYAVLRGDYCKGIYGALMRLCPVAVAFEGRHWTP
jgi:hypothetical protein